MFLGKIKVSFAASRFALLHRMDTRQYILHNGHHHSNEQSCSHRHSNHSPFISEKGTW